MIVRFHWLTGFKFYFILLLLTCFSIWGQCNSCDRAECRSARSILHETVYPLYKFGGLTIPDTCPWSPKWDMYYLQELMKSQLTSRDWKCQLCGKRFYSEQTIDLHMHNRHSSSLLSASDSNITCLAMLCPILRCDVLHPDLAFGDHVYWQEALCRDDQFLEMRQRCEDLLSQCGAGIEELRKWLKIALCDHLTCARYWEIPDHRRPTPTSSITLLTIATILGVVTYYAVLMTRMMSHDSLPPSSLSSPYYFKSISRKHSLRS